MNFNFVKAWNELACKEADRVFHNKLLHGLLIDLTEASRNLIQDSNCDMPWPSEVLHERVRSVGSLVLAEASHAIHAFGHWCPGSKDEAENQDLWRLGKALQRDGGYWKFSYYCDQVLRERLALPNTPPDAREFVSFAIHEGVIRVCFSTRDSWSWRDLGWATESNMEEVNSWNVRTPIDREFKDDNFKKRWDTSKYMTQMSVGRPAG